MKNTLLPLLVPFWSPRVGFHDFSTSLIPIFLLQLVIKFALISEIDFNQNCILLQMPLWLLEDINQNLQSLIRDVGILLCNWQVRLVAD